MEGGPSGPILSQSLYLSLLDPRRSTTDAAFNSLDDIWNPRDRVWIELETFATPDVGTLAFVVEDLRALLDLPAGTVAEMCGVNRRQFYNFLNGSGTKHDRVAWIRMLHGEIVELYEAAAQDKTALRGAILLPLDGGESFLDVAKQGDAHRLALFANQLKARLQSGFKGRVSRPVVRGDTGKRRNDEVGDYISRHS